MKSVDSSQEEYHKTGTILASLNFAGQIPERIDLLNISARHIAWVLQDS